MILRTGQRLPFCVGVFHDQRFYAPDVQAGRAAVLWLTPSAKPGALGAVLASRAADFMALDADVLAMGALSSMPAAWFAGVGDLAGLPVVLCRDDFFAACGLAPGDEAVIVVDRAWRLRGAWFAGDGDSAALACAALCAVRALPREAPRICSLPAPLLPVPEVFTADLCARLIARFDAGARFDSSVNGVTPDGAANERIDYGKKRRTDCLLEPGDGIYEAVRDILHARCAPEIRRAFQRDIVHNDRVLVACYDESGGYFKRHRDNMHEGVAFRQFAISVNLNTGGYDGGELMFPEFNDHLHAPAAGDGIVFSTSLLHEALPVTRGRRYVLLTFFHDAEAERQRLAREPAQGRDIAEPAGMGL